MSCLSCENGPIRDSFHAGRTMTHKGPDIPVLPGITLVRSERALPRLGNLLGEWEIAVQNFLLAGQRYTLTVV